MKLLIGLAVLIVLIVVALAVLCLWNSKNQWVAEGSTTSQKGSITYKTTLRNHLFYPFITATVLRLQKTSPNNQSSFQTTLPEVSMEDAQKHMTYLSSIDGLSLRFKDSEIVCFSY